MLLKDSSPAAPISTETPVYVLAAPGTLAGGGDLTRRHRLTKMLAAGSLLAVAFKPYAARLAPAALNVPTNNYLVINNLDTGPGSLRQAVIDANNHPGFDTITFAPQVSGTIPLSSGQLLISTPLSVQGPGPGKLSVSGGNTQRIFYLYSNTHVPFTATISGLTLRDGHVSGVGGAITVWDVNLTLDDVAVISNTAIGTGKGGGVALEAENTFTNGLTLRNSVISGNHADHKGGGLFLYQGNQGLIIQNSEILTNSAAGYGGGIFFYDTKGIVLIEDSTIAGNSAAHGGGVAQIVGDTHSKIIRRTTFTGNHATSGGAIYLYDMSGPFLIENVTIHNNSVDASGGGIRLYGVSGIGIQNSTIVSNTAGVRGGGLEAVLSVPAITNTILAGNLAPLSPDITGTVQLRYDLVQVTGTATISDAGGNLFGLDPLLGPLADNGGPTQTRLPAHNSPAIDAGDPAFAPPPTTDQRGQPRVSHGRVDMGAVETQVVNKLFLPLLKR